LDHINEINLAKVRVNMNGLKLTHEDNAHGIPICHKVFIVNELIIQRI